MLGIYKITNTINNHTYIGKSTNIEQRWKYHLTHYNNTSEYNKTLYKAFRKYGTENFTFEVLEELNEEQYDLFADEKERYWINVYNSFKCGYNETLGGDGGFIEQARNAIKKLSDEDVKVIRQMYNDCNICLSDAYSLYEDRITKRGFQAIWLGQNHKHIMPEVFTEENKQKHIQLEHQRQGQLRKGMKYKKNEKIL